MTTAEIDRLHVDDGLMVKGRRLKLYRVWKDASIPCAYSCSGRMIHLLDPDVQPVPLTLARPVEAQTDLFGGTP